MAEVIIDENLIVRIGELEDADVNVETRIRYITEADHMKLYNRNKANQHPIEAIENLQESLEELETQAIGSIEIDNIFKLVR